MTQNKLVALVAGTAIALAGTGFASQTKSASPSSAPSAKQEAKKADKGGSKEMSVTRGTIKSISDTQLVLERKTKAGSKDMTFVLNASTQKQGDLKVGEHAVVHYRTENNQEIATMVKAEKATNMEKPAAKSGKSGK